MAWTGWPGLPGAPPVRPADRLRQRRGAARRRPQWDDDEHEVSRWCRLLREYDIAADPTDLDLRRPGPELAAAAAVLADGTGHSGPARGHGRSGTG